jgi:general secretion pathway protein H
MRTLATGIWIKAPRLPAARGFSLLELLVVVTIIGIFAAAAILSMGIIGQDRFIEREAIRLRTLVELLQEEALMESRDYGIWFNASGYRFYVFDYERALWMQAAQDRILGSHDLADGLSLTLAVEDRDIRLPVSLDTRSEDPPEPQIIILSSGELTPFEIHFLRPPSETGISLTAQLDGRLEMVADAG